MKQILLLELLAVSTCVYRSNGFKVRFDNGSEYEGKVEIRRYDNSTQGTVCDSGWDLNDTQVVCRKLGLSAIANDTRDEDYYYEGGNGTIWFESASCNGTESTIEQCPHGEWESTYEQGAGVKCISSNNSDFRPNNKTQQFYCNIEIVANYGKNVYSRDAENPRENLTSLCIALSVHHNTNTGSSGSHPVWIIVSAVAGAIAAFTALSVGLYKIIMPLKWKRRMRYVPHEQKSPEGGSSRRTLYQRMPSDLADTPDHSDNDNNRQSDSGEAEDTNIESTTLLESGES